MAETKGNFQHGQRQKEQNSKDEEPQESGEKEGLDQA
jgi:hypothetical protein